MRLLNASLSLTFDKRASGKLTTALVAEMSKAIIQTLNKNKKSITTHVRSLARANLMDSPEVKSIMDENGKLRIELGVVNGDSDIVKIIDEIISKTNVSVIKSGTPSKEIIIEIKTYIEAEYIDFYSKSYSSYITSGGTQVEWLSWLLEAGNTDVVFGYQIKYGVDIGRTGEAIMLPSKTANWRVPPEFSGVSDNNFVTRSFANIDKELLKFIGGLLQ